MSNSENLAARLHVDLRRQASAICARSLRRGF
ncbi:putative leader peptide [Streptomyces sp. NPDC006624]